MPFTVYYSPKGVFGLAVRSPHATFEAFLGEALSHCHTLPLTREAYHAITDEAEKRKRKRGSFYLPSYPEPPTQRWDYSADTANGFCLACLDLDEGAEPFARSPDALSALLDPWPTFVYHTASSTPQHPRLRVIVQADNLPAASYPKAVQTIAARLGLVANPESLRVVQPMFVPCIFQGEDVVTANPIILARHIGQPLTMADIADTQMPVRAQAQAQRQVDVADELDFLRAPLDGFTASDAVDLLSYLDADCSRPEWVRVGAALKHQFGEDGFPLFLEWSRKGRKFAGEEDCHVNWRSLKVHPRGRAPVTIHTLYHLAKGRGWKPENLIAKNFEACRRWILSRERTETELLSGGPARISQLLDQSPTAETALASCLVDALKERGSSVTRSTIITEVRNLRKIAAKASQVPEKESDIPQWARGLCYVGAPNMFYRRTNRQTYTPESLDREFGKNFLAEEEDSRPHTRPQDYLLNIVKVPCVQDFLYYPIEPNDPFVTYKGIRYVNTYFPDAPAPDEAGALDASMIFLEHLENLVAEEWIRITLLDYFAYLVQHPGRKVRWAPLLQGAQGCGKTFFAEAMRAVIGEANVQTVGSESVMNPNWNEWMAGRQLIVLEEVRVVGANRYDIMNKLKPAITNDVISISERRNNTREVLNFANYLLFTNHHDALAVDDSDRRYFVVESRIQTKQQVKDELGPKYFDRIFGMLRDNARGLRAFFESWEISSSFHPDAHAPETKYRVELSRAASTPLSAAVQDALDDAPSGLVCRDCVSVKALRDYLEVSANVGSFTDHGLTHILRDIGFTHRARVRIDDERHSLWLRGIEVSDEQLSSFIEERKIVSEQTIP